MDVSTWTVPKLHNTRYSAEGKGLECLQTIRLQTTIVCLRLEADSITCETSSDD